MQLSRAIKWVGSAVFGLVIMAVGGLTFSLAWQASIIDQQLEASGVVGTATIDAKETRTVKVEGTKSGQPMLRPEFFVAYSFAADGQPHWGESRVSQSFYTGNEVGDTTPVRYLPDDPDRNAIEFGYASVRNWSGVLGGGILLVLGIVVAGFALFKPLIAAARARRNSRPSPP